ncbi:MAG: SGNH/GDSL hydrolase family protein, partial [Pseudomonadota bacterium]
LTEDGQGAMGQLARGLTEAGTRVVLVGYYNWAPGGKAFVGCKPYLAELDRRMIHLARSQAGIAYVDTKPVIDVADPTHLKPDGIHPSLKGAGLIGRAIARSIGELGSGG